MHWKEKNQEYTRFLTENKALIKQLSNLNNDITTLQKVKHNKKLPSDFFDLDEKIRKLILRKKNLNDEFKILAKKNLKFKTANKRNKGDVENERIVWTQEELIELCDEYKQKVKLIEEEIKEKYSHVSRVNLNLINNNKTPLDVLGRLNMDPEVRLAHAKAEYDALVLDFDRAKETNSETRKLIEEAESNIDKLNKENVIKKENLLNFENDDIEREKARLVRLKLKEKNLKTRLDELVECPFYKESQSLKKKMNALKSKESDLENLKRDVETVTLVKQGKEKEAEETKNDGKIIDEQILSLKKKLIE